MSKQEREVGIVDARSLAMWLDANETPQAEAVVLRASLRLLPHLSAFEQGRLDYKKSNFENTLMACCRLQLTFGVRLLLPAREFQNALDAAAKGLLETANKPTKLGLSAFGQTDLPDLLIGLSGLSGTYSNALWENPWLGLGAFSRNDGLKLGIQGGVLFYRSVEGPNRSLLESYYGSPMAIDVGVADTSGVSKVFARQLWHSSNMPPQTLEAWNKLQAFTDFHEERWHFWREWYQGFLDGKPMDWELQRRVALIPDEDWEKGPEHIAEKIEEIRAAYNSEQTASEPRAPEHEPDNVTELFKHPRSISASLSLSAQTIAQGFESFRAESGLNETPEFLAPLEAIPAYLNRITTILETQPQSATAEQALREEIGRLSARVAQLEMQVAALKDDLETRKRPWFGKVATLSAGIVTLASGLWVVSGDDISPKQRAENLLQYWEHLFPPEETEQERPTLPNLTNT